MSHSFLNIFGKKLIPKTEYFPLSSISGTSEATDSRFNGEPTQERQKKDYLLSGLIVACVVLPTALFIIVMTSYLGWGNTSSLVNYTVESLTRDVQIKAIHSHNDYWRQRPLFDALSNGVVSVEADIWHFPQGLVLTSTASTADKQTGDRSFDSSELYVGHSLFYLKPNNTLNALYLDSIFNLLSQANPQQTYQNKTTATFPGEPQYNGVFYDFPDEPLYLWFDIKTSANDTYTAVKPLLQRFIDKGYLTHYDTTTKSLVKGPIVLTLTGNLPTELVKAEATRYVFLDGSLLSFNLTFDSTSASTLSELSKLSLVASGSLQDILGGAESYQNASRAEFTDEQATRIKDHIDTAHKYGVKTRIWGGINWPNYVKLAHYKTYYELGIDLLNVDDLEQAADEF